MTPKRKKQQQEEIFTTAHRDLAKKLNAHAFYKINDHAIGEDLVQETFLKTWSYLVKGGKIDTMKAFLYHVLNGLIVDQYRKHKAVSLDVMTESGYEPDVEQHDHTENLFDFLDGKSAVLLIERLPLKYQKIIRLRYLQDLSLKEIALITSQSKNTVAVQIHRGFEKLKEIYAEVNKRR